VRLLWFAAFTVALAHGSDKITVYESDHFELITDGSKGRAQDLLGQFERVRSFFTQVLALQEPLMKARVVVFDAEKDFRELAPSEVAAAFYTPLPHRDIIAIGGLKRPGEQHLVVHEYLHMLSRYTDLDLPLWLNEGIAELYSTIQPLGKKIQVGTPIPGHIQQLRNEWPPLERIVAVDHNSPLYNRRAHAGSFYAASWALVHMLSLSPDYRAGYKQMASGIGVGKPADEVFRSVYGRTLPQVEKDLQNYIQGQRVMTILFDTQFDKSYDKVQPRESTSYEWSIARADLLTANRKFAAARTLLESLAKAEPSRPEAWESLAFLHWLSREDPTRERSGEALVKAFELKSTHPNLAYHSPSLTRDAKVSSIALRTLMQQHPDYTDGRIRLAEHLLYAGDFAQSYDEVKKLKRISRRQAPRYFPVLIQASWRLKKFEESRVAASQFKGLARTDADQTSAKAWFTYAMREPPPERPTPNSASTATPIATASSAAETDSPPLRVPDEFPLEDAGTDVARDSGGPRLVTAKLSFIEGLLVNLECKNPQAILTVQSGVGLTRLLIEDPSNVNLSVSGEAKMELTCGPQSNRIKAGYFPRENQTEKTVGALATLEFLK